MVHQYKITLNWNCLSTLLHFCTAVAHTARTL